MSDTPENINNEEEEIGQEPEELIPESSETAEEIPAPDEEIISEPESSMEPESKTGETEKIPLSSESNYQISLVNENLLKIVLKTEKTVGVDCFIKDKSEVKSDPTQTNRITIHPTADGKQHEIEIIVSISPEGEIIVSKSEAAPEAAPKAEEQPVKKKLLIDPALSDLVDKQSRVDLAAMNVPQTWNEFFQERLSSKNKYVVNRRILERNLKTGFIISVLFFFTWAFITFGVSSSKNNGQEEAPEVRLLTIEDIPEMNVDVPLTEKQKQEMEDKGNAGDNTSSPSRVTLPSRKVLRTPKIVTQKDTLPDDTNIAMTNEELDRQRHGGDTTGSGIFGISGVYDSSKVYIDVSQFGWALIDSSKVNRMQLSLFSNDSIVTYIDPKLDLKDFNFQVKKRGVNAEAEIDKAAKNNRPFKDFPVNDAGYKGYITNGPKSEAGTVEYDFMVKNDKVAISILTFTSDELFPQYQAKIEAVIKNIKLPTK